MTNTSYSTTKLLQTEKPIITSTPHDSYETVLFLPPNQDRKGEGGLRLNGYFKKSYDKKPLITIITVVFSGEEYLEETILSVINQTYENVEYIIIDGGSTDNTLDIIRKYEDQIDYWVSEKDHGIYDAMNKGINLSLGNFLFFLGADDILTKGILKTIFSNIRNELSIIYGNAEYHNNTLIKSNFSYKTFLHNTIHHQAAFYNQTLFNNFRYDVQYKIAADYELNLILFLNNSKKTLYINHIFSVCRDNGISRTQVKLSHHEMSLIRNKHVSDSTNHLFSTLLTIKVFLLKILNYRPFNKELI